MAIINQATKELQVKIVYYGPAKSGKTTNLEQIHDVTLRALTGPFGADASYSALKNHFGPPHQIIKRRGDNGSSQSHAGDS